MITVDVTRCMIMYRSRTGLVEESESHVVILLLGFLLLLLLLGGFSSTAGSGSGSGGGSNSASNVGDQSLQVRGLQSLGEKSGPVGLELHTSSLQDGGDLLAGDGNIVIGQAEGGVAAGKLRVGHVGSASFAEDLAQKLRTSTKLLLMK